MIYLQVKLGTRAQMYFKVKSVLCKRGLVVCGHIIQLISYWYDVIEITMPTRYYHLCMYKTYYCALIKMADTPMFPFHIFQTLEHTLSVIELIESENDVVPPFPVEILEFLYEAIVEIDALSTYISRIFNVLFPHGRQQYTEVWPRLARNSLTFWFIYTSETQDSLQDIVRRLGLQYDYRQYEITQRDCVLMTFIWIRQYPVLEQLAHLFSLPVSSCWEIIRTHI